MVLKSQGFITDKTNEHQVDAIGLGLWYERRLPKERSGYVQDIIMDAYGRKSAIDSAEREGGGE